MCQRPTWGLYNYELDSGLDVLIRTIQLQAMTHMTRFVFDGCVALITFCVRLTTLKLWAACLVPESCCILAYAGGNKIARLVFQFK